MIRVACRHWHSFLQNCCVVALRCMSACPPWESRASALACLTAIMGAEKSELTPLSFLLVFFTHVKKLSVTRLTNSSGRTLCLHTHTNTTLTHSGSEGAGMKRVIHSLKLHILIPSCVCPRFGCLAILYHLVMKPRVQRRLLLSFSETLTKSLTFLLASARPLPQTSLHPLDLWSMSLTHKMTFSVYLSLFFFRPTHNRPLLLVLICTWWEPPRRSRSVLSDGCAVKAESVSQMFSSFSGPVV